MGYLPLPAAVHVHHVDLLVTVMGAAERDKGAVRRPDGPGWGGLRTGATK